jgi:hypothetical protein
MRFQTALALVLVGVLARPAPGFAWGFEVHRRITVRAIDLLPDAIRPFFTAHKTFLEEHSIDPDLWRTVGWIEEPPRHFLDLDAYGAFPFADLPRDFEAAVARHGRDVITKNGLLPWRAEEMFSLLTKAFEQHRAGTNPYALDNVKLFSTVLGHYVSDAHVPFHAVLNHDGQLTNQHGIHARFETELFLRYEAKLRLTPPPLLRITNPREFVFETLLASFKLVPPILGADRTAVKGRDLYDDRYFDQFFGATRTLLERRLSETISGVASAITSAWEQAGRPDLRVAAPRAPRPVRRGEG